MCYEQTSHALEFYGLTIPIEDSKKLSYILDNLSEHDKLSRMYEITLFGSLCNVCPLQDALYKITCEFAKCTDMCVKVISGKNKEYLLLGKLMNHSTSTHQYSEIDLTANPTLSNDMLENMKKVYSLLEIDSPFESYEIMHKIYHFAK